MSVFRLRAVRILWARIRFYSTSLRTNNSYNCKLFADCVLHTRTHNNIDLFLFKKNKTRTHTMMVGCMCPGFSLKNDFKIFTTNLCVACVFSPQNMGVDPHIFTFAIFAGTFMTRISGALLFDYIEDKFGRKLALLLSILFMSIATTSIWDTCCQPLYRWALQPISATASMTVIFPRMWRGRTYTMPGSCETTNFTRCHEEQTKRSTCCSWWRMRLCQHYYSAYSPGQDQRLTQGLQMRWNWQQKSLW